jgi:hypothetical protein
MKSVRNEICGNRIRNRFDFEVDIQVAPQVWNQAYDKFDQVKNRIDNEFWFIVVNRVWDRAGEEP